MINWKILNVPKYLELKLEKTNPEIKEKSKFSSISKIQTLPYKSRRSKKK